MLKNMFIQYCDNVSSLQTYWYFQHKFNRIFRRLWQFLKNVKEREKHIQDTLEAKQGGLALLDTQTYDEATDLTVWFWHKDRKYTNKRQPRSRPTI